MSRAWLCVAACLGALGVVLGAFGAHGIEPWLADAPGGERRLHWWRTAASYHLWHALALGLASMALAPGRLATLSRWAFVVGIALFSGSLYVMTVTHVTALGMVTPLGGLSLIVGWLSMALAAYQARAGR